jgi:Actin-like ATPase involved in cell division
MANQQGSFLTAIDVGSAKTCALMAELTDSGLRYRGHGVADSRGSRKGVIVELDKAVASIQKAVEAAEDIAGAPVEHAIVGVGGGNIRGVNSHGGISLGTRPRKSGATRSSRPSSAPALSRFLRIAKFFICSPRNLSLMIRPGYTIPWV